MPGPHPKPVNLEEGAWILLFLKAPHVGLMWNQDREILKRPKSCFRTVESAILVGPTHDQVNYTKENDYEKRSVKFGQINEF